MDFLDPKAKKIRNIRLMIGYVLVFVLIITSSLILVFRAYGFDVDRKTGQVIQNGLVYIDSAPDGAEIYLNGALHKDRTNARMILPEGKYDLLIKKEGYRDWNRNFEVKGGSVERVTYPLLLLAELDSSAVSNLGELRPAVATQSPDRRWLMISRQNSPIEYTEYDLNNLGRESDKPEETPVTFPASLFTPLDGAQKIAVIEWSTDNKNFLIKHTYGSGHEFIILNREDPSASINVNKLLDKKPDSVTLRDKKSDQWYLYTKEDGLLQSAGVNSEMEVVARNVVSYKTHDSTVVLYAVKTANNLNTIFLRQNGNTYNLRNVAAGAVKLNIARFDGEWFSAIASDGDKRTYIYKNPQVALQRQESLKPAPVAVFKASSAINGVAFSTNTRFIMAQDGQHIGIYDAEKNESHDFELKEIIDKGTKVSWMDGHRVQYRSGGQETIFDFDGSNSQKLVSTISGEAAFFDRDYTVIYTISKEAGEGRPFILNSTALRLEADK